MPDEGDGHVLFDIATRRRQALDLGAADPGGVAGLGDIVAVPPVRRARDAGALNAGPMFTRLTPEGPQWPDDTTTETDAAIWCTGFRPSSATSRR